MGKVKKVAVAEEVVEAVVEAPVVKKKKSKKEKKPVEDVDTAAESPADSEEVEEAPKEKKKKKKSKAVEEEAEENSEEPPKKKKKKSKAVEEEAAEEPKKEEKKEESDAESDSEEPPAKKAKTEETKTEESSEAPASKTVFIGGFPYSTTEEVLKKDFAECGEIVSFRFPMDYEGTPKGIAFCEFTTVEAVKKALEYNETDYGGRQIRVNVEEGGSKGKGKGKGKKGGKSREPGEKPDGCKSVVVKNFSYDATEDDLWKAFEGIGTIERLKLLTDRDTGASKGIAFVDFATTEDVDLAMKERQNHEMGGRNLFIDYSGGKGEGKGDKGKGKGKDGKGKGKKGKGKGKGKPVDPSRAKVNGGIQEFAGAAKTFDSDSD